MSKITIENVLVCSATIMMNCTSSFNNGYLLVCFVIPLQFSVFLDYRGKNFLLNSLFIALGSPC